MPSFKLSFQTPVGGERNDFRIVLDAGHGGEDGGTTGTGILEKVLTLDMTWKVARRLEASGWRVEMTRERDETVPLWQRVQQSNYYPNSLFVSIHVNADGRSARSHGIETFYTRPKEESARAMVAKRFGLEAAYLDSRSEEFAQVTQDALVAATGARDRGIESRAYLVTRQTAAPSILIECGFLSNPEEAKKLATRAYRDRLVEGIVAGVEAFASRTLADPGRGLQGRSEGS
ncbi:MAG: N-acetylmuramoyl-L-alanine amidase [Verrucomicrobiota bacterium]